MSSSAEPTVPDTSTPMLALAGAASLLGKEIKRQLAKSGVAGDAVTLLDLEELAGLLTDYGDEARVMLEAATHEILGHDLACFCGTPEMAAAHLERLLEGGRIGLDCTGAWNGRDDVFLWIPGLTPAPHLDTDRAIALPGAATLVLGAALAALGDLGRDAAASLFLPASERGDAGLHELSRQTIAVLNLEDVDTAVFGRQLAFDLWPAAVAAAAATGGAAVATELARLGLPVPAITVFATGVFHGVSLSLFLPHAGPDEVATALGAAGITVASPDRDERVDSPVRAAGQGGLHAGGVRGDDAGGTWAWIVGDNLALRAAAAVAAIHAILGPAARGAAPTI